MDEKHALQALRRRDETALAWFIERYAPYVNTIIFHIIGDAMSSRDVEEVSSDVFLVLWKNAGKIRPGKMKAYLSGTARNMAKAKLRELGQELPLEEDILMTSPIREKNIIASERIKEVTMAKIHMNEANSGFAGKKLGKGTIALLIAAAVLALSVTAYASGLFSRLVNWQGQTLETETEPMATMPPDAERIGDEAKDAVINSLLEQREDRELIIVRHDGSASSTERTAPLTSVGELSELLTKESSTLTVPINVPEDYTLVMGRVCFESAQGYGYTLTSKETREDGSITALRPRATSSAGTPWSGKTPPDSGSLFWRT